MRDLKHIGGVAAVAAAVALIAFAVGALPADAGEKKTDEGYLGVYMQELDSEVKQGLDLKVDEGVLISGIVDESPAAEAGLKDGDVIVTFAGKAVTSPDQLRDLVRDTAPGTEVKVKLVRDGKNKTITLKISDRPEEFWQSWSGTHRPEIQFSRFLGGPTLGVSAAELNDGLAEYFDTKPESGVLVLEVMEETVAEEAGVKAGDVIQKIDDEDITSVKDLRQSLHDFDEGDEFNISVLRKGKTKTLKATMDDQDMLDVFNGHARHFRMDASHFKVPRMHMERMGEDIREELDELRRELDELKKELKAKS